MASVVAAAQMAAQQRLRDTLVLGVASAWAQLPGYDETNVPAWLRRVVPMVTAAQRQSAQTTVAYIARSTRRPPVTVKPSVVTGAPLRDGTAPNEVYRRPFVTVWTALSKGVPWEQAVAAGLARATGMAAMDVQLTQRETLRQAQLQDPTIRGYQRVADPGACTFCTLIDGAFVKSADAMPLHPGCGCTLAPVMTEVTPTRAPADVAVHDHGELGPVLGSPDQDFTQL